MTSRTLFKGRVDYFINNLLIAFENFLKSTDTLCFAAINITLVCCVSVPGFAEPVQFVRN